MKSVTIKDIARAARVSHPTVSKALNGSPGVNEQTREHILLLAKQMGYVPNVAAQRLANKKNRSIGFIWPELEGLFFYHLCNALQREALRREIDVFVSMSPPGESLRNFNSHFIDFVMCWFLPNWTPPADFIRQRETYRGEITIVGGGVLEGSNLVLIDRGKGVFDAVKYLHEIGHRRVAYVGDENDKSVGYLKGMLQCGMDYHEECMILSSAYYYNYSDNVRDTDFSGRFEQLWRSDLRPTALILDSQGTAFGMLNTLHRLGISIPRDLSVICYDDIPELSIFEAPLTTCSPSRTAIVNTVLDIYEAYFAGEAGREKRREIILPELIVRESCRPVAGVTP